MAGGAGAWGFLAVLFGLLVAGLAVVVAPAAADYGKGLAAFNDKDYAEAYKEWIDAAKAGEAAAQHGIGMLYDMGEGVPKADPKVAAEWYQKAADQNYAPAINNLARLYADGRGVPGDPAKAIALWSRAAEAGNVTARFNLGVQYANGNGVEKDQTRAAEYLRQAAEGGLAEAQFALAGFYREGLGVPKDPVAAREWYQRAADAGHEPAREALAALKEADAAAQRAAVPQPVEPSATAASGESAPPLPPEPAVPAQSAVDTKLEGDEAPGQAGTPPAGEARQAAGAASEAAAPAQPGQPMEEVPASAAEPEAAAEAGATGGQETQSEEQVAAGGQTTAAASGADQAPASGEGSVATTPPDVASDLPLAESLSGDARVYRIWLYDTGQEKDGASYWAKLSEQYPGVLKGLTLDLRRYFLGEAKGAVYRVFAGPFDSLAAAQEACAEVKRQFADQFCRPVVN